MHDEFHKMITNSREEEASTKQGIITQNTDGKVSISSRLWTSLKNPRIVRVSRSFGGKDRHSKVTTVRGLRDRRVRLSVPTAIQLYDLQDKLGLNQPSKVVDWLLNAAQHEIDKLPPLEIPPGNLMQFPQSMPVIFDRIPSPKASSNHKVIGNVNGFLLDNHKGHQDVSSSVATSTTFNTNLVDDMTMYPKSTHWNSDVFMRMKEKEALEELKNSDPKDCNNKENELGNEGSTVSLMNNINAVPYSSYYQLEPSTAYLSYLRSHSLSSPEMHHGYHPISMFTPCMTSSTPNLDARQYSYFQLASFPSENHPSNRLRGYLQSGSPSMGDLQLNSNSKLQVPEEQQQK